MPKGLAPVGEVRVEDIKPSQALHDRKLSVLADGIQHFPEMLEVRNTAEHVHDQVFARTADRPLRGPGEALG